MHKRLFTITIIIVMLTINVFPCYAADLYDRYRTECNENLANYGFNILVSDFSEGITRREAFELCYKLQNDNADPYEAIVNYYNDNLNDDIFVDVKKYSKDYYFTQLLLDNNLMKGCFTEGSLYARLDDYVTYGEALTIILRALSRHGYFSIDFDLLVIRYGADNTYYHYAEDIGLINTKNPSDNFSVKITTEDLSKTIPTYDFAILLDRALYIPSASPGDYAPPIRYYTIEKCMKHNSRFLSGDINEYTLNFVGTRYDILSHATKQEGQNPLIVEIDDNRKKVFMYDENFKFPIEIYIQGAQKYNDFDNITVGTSTLYDVKKFDPDGNYAIPYCRDTSICSLHCTVDGKLLMVYYEAVEQDNSNVSMIVSKIVDISDTM